MTVYIVLVMYLDFSLEVYSVHRKLEDAEGRKLWLKHNMARAIYDVYIRQGEIEDWE